MHVWLNGVQWAVITIHDQWLQFCGDWCFKPDTRLCVNWRWLWPRYTCMRTVRVGVRAKLMHSTLSHPAILFLVAIQGCGIPGSSLVDKSPPQPAISNTREDQTCPEHEPGSIVDLFSSCRPTPTVPSLIPRNGHAGHGMPLVFTGSPAPIQPPLVSAG